MYYALPVLSNTDPNKHRDLITYRKFESTFVLYLHLRPIQFAGQLNLLKVCESPEARCFTKKAFWSLFSPQPYCGGKRKEVQTGDPWPAADSTRIAV